MKPQFFPDEHDYVKLSILRHLLQKGLTCTICWMMTQNDSKGRSDGREYLNFPDLFKHYDPNLFDYLKEQVDSRPPDIRSIKHGGLFANCRFYWRDFPDPPNGVARPQHLDDRKKYFDECLDKAKGTDLVFFDPDTGPMPDTTKLKDWHKYVRWCEIARIYNAGYSVLVFNSLRGKTLKNNRLVVQRTRWLQDNLETAKVTVLRTPDLAFYFAVQEKHWDAVERARAAILERWRDLPLWPSSIHSARPQTPTFGDLLLEIPRDDQEFERLSAPDRPMYL